MATYNNPLSQENNKNILDILSASQGASDATDAESWSTMASGDKRAAINAGMSTPGGIGDKLMSGGISAGLMGAGPVGWGAAGGGLVLSLIEAEQKKKAEEEAQRVAAENQKTENMKSQIGKLMNMRLGVQ